MKQARKVVEDAEEFEAMFSETARSAKVIAEPLFLPADSGDDQGAAKNPTANDRRVSQFKGADTYTDRKY